MHVFSKQMAKPIDTGHGEFISELVGPDFDEKTERHSVAHVLIPPGKASLLHKHPVAEESYYILKGEAHILVGEEEKIIKPNEIVLIPPEKPHKISNNGDEDLEFLVICVPAWEPDNSILLE